MPIGIGGALREARERQGRTLQDASQATRVRTEYLRALEDEEFHVIGSDVYAKGFLTTYARYLELDPEPLLDRYRHDVQTSGYDPHALLEHPVAVSPSRSVPRWLTWTVAAAFVLAAAYTVAQASGGRTPAPAQEPTELAGAATPTEEPEATPSPSPTPTPSVAPTSVELSVLVEDTTWMSIEIDGRVVFQGTLRAGDTRQFSAPDSITLHLGNAGGVNLILNDRSLGAPGSRGQVVRGDCTPEACNLTSRA
ncbi:MAG: helix-turn-helix domain-containing protein [Nitriliruptorales bacterium]